MKGAFVGKTEFWCYLRCVVQR